MKQILVMMVAVVLVGCGTTGGSSSSAESNPPVDPAPEVPVDSYWISDPSDPNNVKIEKAIRSRLRKQKGELTKSDLAKITHLNLHSKGLTSVAGLEKLTNLTSLNLDGNKLRSVAGLENLTNLTNLNLYYNQLTSVAGLEKLTNLSFLSLENNQLTSVAGLEKLTNLTSLNLHRNKLMSLAGLEKLTNLTSLNLDGNKLTSVAELESLTNLTSLQLSGNRLTSIAGLENLTNLTSLNLSSNGLTKIPAGLGKLTNLEFLNLHNNQLTNVAGLEKFTNLTSLNLSGNQLANSQIAQLKKDLPKVRVDWNMLAAKPPTPILPKNAEQLYKDGANYYFGQNGRQRDYSKAAKLFQDAAFLGHPMAQINLGACYMHGNGVDLNFQIAIAFWKIVILNPRASNEDKASAANNIKVLSGKIAKAPKGGQSMVDLAMALADKAVESMIKSNPKMIGK